MPTVAEFVEFFHPNGHITFQALETYEGINWDPRMFMAMKAQSLKGKYRNRRDFSGRIGALVPTFQTNVACTAAEWQALKQNYTRLLEIEQHLEATATPAAALGVNI